MYHHRFLSCSVRFTAHSGVILNFSVSFKSEVYCDWSDVLKPLKWLKVSVINPVVPSVLVNVCHLLTSA